MANSLYNPSVDVNAFNAGINNQSQMTIQSSAPRILSSASPQAQPYVSQSRQTYQPNTFGLNDLFNNLGTEAANAVTHLFGGDTNQDLEYQAKQLSKMSGEGYTLSTDEQGTKQWINAEGDTKPYKAYDDTKSFGDRIIPQGSTSLIGQQLFDGLMAYKLARWQGADRGNASSAMIKSMMYQPKRPDYKWNTQVDANGNLMAYTVTGTKYDAQGNPLPIISTGDTGIDVAQKGGSQAKIFSLTRDGAGNLFKVNAFTGETTPVEGSEGKPTKETKPTGVKTFTAADGTEWYYDPKKPEEGAKILLDIKKPKTATQLKADSKASKQQTEVVNNSEALLGDLITAANNPYMHKVVGGLQGNEVLTSVTTAVDDNYNQAFQQVKKLLGTQMQANIAVQGRNFSDGDRIFFQSYSDFSPTMADTEMDRRINSYAYAQSKIAHDANTEAFKNKHGYTVVNNSLNKSNGTFQIQVVQDDGSMSEPVRVDAKALAGIDRSYQGLGNVPSVPDVQPVQTSQYQEGMTATNPNTGQKVIYRNGQWEAL